VINAMSPTDNTSLVQVNPWSKDDFERVFKPGTAKVTLRQALGVSSVERSGC